MGSSIIFGQGQKNLRFWDRFHSCEEFLKKSQLLDQNLSRRAFDQNQTKFCSWLHNVFLRWNQQEIKSNSDLETREHSMIFISKVE